MSRLSSISLPSIQFLCQIGGLVLYYAAYRSSRRKLADYYARKVQISLSSQYNLRQITDITGTYLPIVCFNGLCFLLFFLPSAAVRNFGEGNVELELKIAMLTEYLGFSTQIACSNVFVLLKCDMIRQAVIGIPLISKLAQIGSQVEPQSSLNEGNARLLHLEQIWEQAHELAERRRSRGGKA